MAKKSVIERNEKRKRLTKKFAAKRARLKALTRDNSLTPEERFNAQLKLAELPRNSSPVRVRAAALPREFGAIAVRDR